MSWDWSWLWGDEDTYIVDKESEPMDVYRAPRLAAKEA